MSKSFIPNRHPKTIVVAGSKEIMTQQEQKIKLTKRLGAKIVQQTNWVLLTGGALSIRETLSPTAIDYWVAKGAEDEAYKRGISPNSVIHTLHPLTTNHPLHDIGLVNVTKRKTAALRRFDLVAEADGIICVEGLSGLNTIMELSIALNKPLVPIPCTGGTSLEIWNTYETELLERLQINKDSQDYIVLTQSIGAVETLSETVIRILKNILMPFCYVIFPANQRNEMYEQHIQPLLNNLNLQPRTSDDIPLSTSKLSSIIEIIENSQLIIADISKLHPAVFEQIGIAETLRKHIIILCEYQSKESFDKLGYAEFLNNRVVIFYNLDNLEKCFKDIEKAISQFL